MQIEFYIPVIPRTKKNSMIKTKTGLIQSEVYRQYEKDCLMVIPGDFKQLHINKPCILTTVFYMPDNRRVDISNLISAIDDVLVKAGVLQDDSRKIVTKRIAWCETSERAGTMVRIEVIG